MFSKKRFAHEQPQSLVAALEEAGVLHGDTTEVNLTAGVYVDDGTPIMAFCPTVIQSVRVLKSGTSQEHDQPISADVRLNDQRRLRKIIGLQEAFISGRAIIHSNGSTQITFDPKSIVRHRVHGFRVNSQESRGYSRQILAGVNP